MKVFGRLLLVAIVVEVALGGGGRLIDIGHITPRMVLFGLGLAYSVARLAHREEIPREFMFLTGAFIALSGISALVSALENRPVLAVFSDFKPLAYFLLLPFFAITIRNVNDVVLVSKMWKASALVLSTAYLVIMLVWKLDFLTTAQVIGWLNPEHDPGLEFYFRGETTFFFKALLYVGVGVFFFSVERGLTRYAVLLILLLGIAVTMTRGVWLSVFMVLAAWAFIYHASRIKGAALAAGLIFVGVVGVVWINETLPSVAISNAIRINDGVEFEHMATGVTLHLQEVLFGQGFGATILGRQAVEIAYANVLYKQGMMGIVFWFLPIGYLVWQMRDIRHPEMRAFAMPYFMSAAFVYVVSLTNPFLTNPIGMSVVMIAMIAIRVIRQSSNSVLVEAAPSPPASARRGDGAFELDVWPSPWPPFR